MAINYVVKQRVNPRDAQGVRKYYAIAKSTGEESTRQFATEISKRTGLSTSDVMASIEAFLDLITDRTLEGKIVRLGDFGSFSINISSEGVDKAEDLNASNIKSNSLQFRTGKVVNQKLAGAEYKKVSD